MGTSFYDVPFQITFLWSDLLGRFVFQPYGGYFAETYKKG